MLAVREQFEVTLQVEGVFLPLVVSPTLPSGVTLSGTTLRGSFTKQGIYKYTVTASNEVGQNQVVVEFNVGTCPDNQSLMTLSRSYGREGESVSIYTMEGEELLSVEFTNSAYSKTLCMANADYRVVMRTR